MTKPRITDNPIDYELPFSDWLRKNPKLSSCKGFITTNVDYIWKNYKTGDFILLEIKTFMAELKFPQTKMLYDLDDMLKPNKKYKGFYLIQFDKTNPEDSRHIKINNKFVTKEKLEYLLENFKERL